MKASTECRLAITRRVFAMQLEKQSARRSSTAGNSPDQRSGLSAQAAAQSPRASQFRVEALLLTLGSESCSVSRMQCSTSGRAKSQCVNKSFYALAKTSSGPRDRSTTATSAKLPKLQYGAAEASRVGNMRLDPGK